jgi:uncharacterized membrane protein YccC
VKARWKALGEALAFGVGAVLALVAAMLLFAVVRPVQPEQSLA